MARNVAMQYFAIFSGTVEIDCIDASGADAAQYASFGGVECADYDVAGDTSTTIIIIYLIASYRRGSSNVYG